MQSLRFVLFIFLLIGLFYLEASRMFVVETSIHFSILYPIGVFLCSLFIVKSGSGFLDRNNRGILLLVVWLYIITLLHSAFTPLPAKYYYVTLILPSICLYLPQKLLNSNFNQKYFDRGNIIVFALLLFYYFYNYQNNIFIDIDSQNNSAYTVLFFAPILLCINNKYIRYIVLFLTGIALLFSLKRSGIAAFALGLVAFAFGTFGGVMLGKLMCKLSGGKINPLIGSAGVSAVPMAARVSQKVGAEADPTNFLLMHAMGPNVAGVIGTAVAAGTFMAIFGV